MTTTKRPPHDDPRTGYSVDLPPRNRATGNVSAGVPERGLNGSQASYAGTDHQPTSGS